MSKQIISILLLAALLSASHAGAPGDPNQIVAVDCDLLYDNIVTNNYLSLNNAYGDPAYIPIASVYLPDYFIPSLVNNYCNTLSAMAELPPSERKPIENAKRSSFLETSQGVTEDDIVKLILTDISLIAQCSDEPTGTCLSDNLQMMQDYCTNTLRPYFSSYTFPVNTGNTQGVEDDYNKRTAYLTASFDFQVNWAYTYYLQC